MIGVKEFIKQFQEPIDWDTKAKKAAKKEGVSVEDIKEQWEEDRLNGISIHKQICERDVIKGGVLCKSDSGTTSIDYNTIDNKILPGVYLERPISSIKYGLKGVVDKIERINHKIIITDNKSWKKVYRSAMRKLPNGISIPPKKFFAPIGHLDECNYVEVCLQCSLYAFIIWENNKELKIDKLYLNHVTANKDKILKEDLIEIPYLRTEIKELIKTLG